MLRPSPRKLAAGARGFGGAGSTASSGLHGIGGGHQPSRLGFNAVLPAGNGGVAAGTPPEGLTAGWGAEEQQQRQASQLPPAGPGPGRLADSSATLEHNVPPVLSPAGPEALGVAPHAASAAPSGRGMQPWKASGPAQAATAAAQLAARQRADPVPPAGVRAEQAAQQGSGAPEPQQGGEGQWQEELQQPGYAGDWEAHRRGELQSQPEGSGSQPLWEGGPAQHAAAAAHSLPRANGILQRPEQGGSLSPPGDQGLANTAVRAEPQQQQRQAAWAGHGRAAAYRSMVGSRSGDQGLAATAEQAPSQQQQRRVAWAGRGRAAAYRGMLGSRAESKRAGSHDDELAADRAGSAKRQRGNGTAVVREPAGQDPAGRIRDVQAGHPGGDVIDSQGTDHWWLSQAGFEPASQQSQNSPEPSTAPMHHQVCSYRGPAVGRMAENPRPALSSTLLCSVACLSCRVAEIHVLP